MSELQFVEFEEVNDWEGETWTFWLQLTGNEDELTKLDDLLSQAEREIEYELPFTLYLENCENESVVDKLVQHSEEGYYDSHNMVLGKFTCPESLGEAADELYKGGIRDYFKKDA
jgi:hypothetical protein